MLGGKRPVRGCRQVTHKPWNPSSPFSIRFIESAFWQEAVPLILLYELGVSVEAGILAHHMTAPVPARTLSAKLGRYSSLSVLSAHQTRCEADSPSTSLDTSVQSVLPPSESSGPVHTGSCSYRT
jgi:hypothetical protein